jgi:signal transduction histidine kinase
MRSQLSRRHPLLLVAALAVPCLVLMVLGIQIIGKERELAIRRLDDEPRRVIAQITGELMTTVERIKLDEAGRLAASRAAETPSAPRRPEVAVVAWLRDGRLILPWDEGPAVGRMADIGRDTPFAHAIEEGERLEFGPQRFAEAARAYGRAKTRARDRSDRDYADLLRARAMAKDPCECTPPTLEIHERLLSSEAMDDQGIPIALYAARELLRTGVGRQRVLELFDRRLRDPAWFQPLAMYLARDLLASVLKDTPDPNHRRRAQDLLTNVSSELADIEQALALQREFAALVFPDASGHRDSDWRLFGTEPWLVSQAPAVAGLPPFVIALRFEPIAAALQTEPKLLSAAAGQLTFFSGGTAGLPLGDRFPQVRAAFPAADQEAAMKRWALQRTFYIGALILVVGMTVLGGYLSWRDTRRELELAAMRSQFVASVSHELRTPLTAIRMFAETLQMERPLDPSARAEYLSTIVHESERLTRLINNVLDFSQIERGQKVYRREPTPLGTIVRQVVNTMEYPLARQGFDLRVTAREDLPAANIDADAIQQAMLNLLSNAMKYSTDRRRIDLTLSGVNGHAVIQVTDYGLGIAPQDQTRVFERFYRASIPENARIPGAGLGLALVDHIVAAHGGSVHVSSTPGEGSTFAIHLPLETPA